ncbi:hypothetical protein V2J09_014572 [Rumex salicifolius]
MATSIVPISIAGGSHLKTNDCTFLKPSSFRELPKNTPSTSRMVSKKRSVAIQAEYNGGGRSAGGGGDFVAGFLLGGAVFGSLAYIFAPQIRRSILNEDEYGFRKAKRPIYYDDDDGLEKTRQTLNAKLGQLNSAIDKVSSRLRGGNNATNQVPVETDPEVEATMSYRFCGLQSFINQCRDTGALKGVVDAFSSGQVHDYL